MKNKISLNGVSKGDSVWFTLLKYKKNFSEYGFSALSTKYNIIIIYFRHGVSFKNIAGESKSVTEQMTAPWTKTTLPTILSRYTLKNMFNVDKSGAFCQCLSNNTLHLEREKCSGGKFSKVGLTGLAAGNGYSDRLPKFVVGKSKNQDVLKASKVCLVDAVLNAKAGCLQNFFKNGYGSSIDNRKFASVKRKNALIIHNFTAHPHMENFEWIALIFFPE